MPETVYIHVGAHKTGTTFLQASLSQSLDALEANGLSYVPQTAYWKGMFAAVTSVEESVLQGKPPLTIPTAELRALVDEKSVPAVIISQEDFAGTTKVHKTGKMYPAFAEIIGQIYEGFSDMDVRFVLTTRDHAAFFESCVLQQIQQGAVFDIGEAVGKFDYRTLAWMPKYDFLVSLVGAEKVLLMAAEDCHTNPMANVRRLLTWAGVGDIEMVVPTSNGAKNVSLSQLGLDLALAANGRIKGADWVKFRTYLRDNLSEGRRRAEVLPLSLRELIRAYHAEEDQRLKALKNC